MSSPIGKADYEGAEGRLKVETIARIYAEKAQTFENGLSQGASRIFILSASSVRIAIKSRISLDPRDDYDRDARVDRES